MVNSNFSPQDKQAGDLILSADWNAAMSEIKRLEKAKLNREGADTFKGTLTIQEALNVTGDVKILGNRLKSADGFGIVETNKKDWLRINPDENYPAIALYKPVAIGTGGLAIGEWEQLSQGVLKVTQSTYLATAGGNVGIGTTNPTEKLEVSGNIKATGSITGNHLSVTGNVGIGTISPAYTLDVNGSVRLGGFTRNDVDEWPKVVWYRDTNADWDEGLIKHSSTRGIFKTAGYGIHLHQSRQFGLWSTGWNPLFAVRGGTGDAYLRGNLGIGSNPAQDKLDVAGNLRILSNTNPIRFTSSWSNFPDAVTNQAEICNDTRDYKTLMIVGNKSAGEGRRVSVWDKLEVNGDQIINGNLELQSLKIRDPHTRNHAMNIYFESGNQTIVFYHQSGIGQFMRQDGKWQLNSDICLKDNILEINNILEKTLQLRPVTFKWKNTDINDIGFIAQDVEKVFPNLVSSVNLSQQAGKEIKGLPYSHFGVIAIAAIQEMKKYYDSKIEILEQKLSQISAQEKV